MVECTCRECKKTFENAYPYKSICEECWNKFNTPKIQKAREKYQEEEKRKQEER